MTKLQIIEKLNIDGSIIQHVVIENEDGSFTSMLKSTWDELEAQREQSGTLTTQGGIN